jgi:hypothetical protein
MTRRDAHLATLDGAGPLPDAAALVGVPVHGPFGGVGPGRVVAAGWHGRELHATLELPEAWAEVADAAGLEAACAWHDGRLDRVTLTHGAAPPITPAGSPEPPLGARRDGAPGGSTPEGGPAEMAATTTQQQAQSPDDETTRTADERARRDGARDDGRPEDDNPDPAALKAELERLRKAHAETNRRYAADRHRLEEIDRAAEERRKEELPEVERVRADLKARDAEIRARDDHIRQLEREADDLRIDILVIQEAAGKFKYPKAALKLIDRGRIQVDPDTREVLPSTVKDAIKRVLDEFRDLAVAEPGGGSPAARIGARPAAGAGRTAPEPTLRERVARTGGYEAM